MVDGTHPMMFDCLTIGDDMLLWILMVYPSWMVRTLGNSVGVAIPQPRVAGESTLPWVRYPTIIATL